MKNSSELRSGVLGGQTCDPLQFIQDYCNFSLHKPKKDILLKWEHPLSKLAILLRENAGKYIHLTSHAENKFQ